MRLPPRPALLLSLLLLGAAPVRRGGLPVAPVATEAARVVEVRPVLLSIPEAVDGPPDMSCAAALSIAAEDRALTSAVVRGESAPAQDLYDRSEAASGKGTFEGADWTPAERVPIPSSLRTQWSRVPCGMDRVPISVEGAPILWHVGDVLRAADGERVRISVFGASHTEADYFTGTCGGCRPIGDIGHGFIWPADPVAQYRANDVTSATHPVARRFRGSQRWPPGRPVRAGSQRQQRPVGIRLAEPRIRAAGPPGPTTCSRWGSPGEAPSSSRSTMRPRAPSRPTPPRLACCTIVWRCRTGPIA